MIFERLLRCVEFSCCRNCRSYRLWFFFVCVIFSGGAQSSFYQQVYTIQLAAFESTNKASRFIDTVPNMPLYCRTKSNGLEVVYYGVYPSWDSAKAHLRDYSILTDLGAYVLRLDAVMIKPCENLALRIERQKQIQVIPQVKRDSLLATDIYQP